MENKNTEKTVTAKDARELFKFEGATIAPADVRARLKPFEVETVEDIMMLIALAMKHDMKETLIDIHDRMMVTDIEITYDVLIFMIKLGDDREMYNKFVPASVESAVHKKGVYIRCLSALPIYNTFAKPYYNPALDAEEYYPEFGKDVLTPGANEQQMKQEYRAYILEKYADLMKKIIEIK